MSHRPFCTAIILTVLVPLTARGQAPQTHTSLDVKARGAKAFYVDRGAGNNQISVFSESTLEDFTIVCNEIAGKWQVDPGDVEAINGQFSLRVKDLKTGIELRDHHLQSADWLDADKHPEIVLKIIRAEDVKKVNKNSATMNLAGTCSLHGRTRDVRMPCTLAYLDESPETMRRAKGDLVRLRADFKIKLSDYGVFGPAGSDFIGLKVANELPIKVTVFGSTQPPPEPLKPDTGGPASRPAGGATSRPAGQPSTMPSILQPPTRSGPER